MRGKGLSVPADLPFRLRRSVREATGVALIDGVDA